jgi:hypothetical protein
MDYRRALNLKIEQIPFGQGISASACNEKTDGMAADAADARASKFVTCVDAPLCIHFQE